MKIKREYEDEICDKCGGEFSVHTCAICGKDLCEQCTKWRELIEAHWYHSYGQVCAECFKSPPEKWLPLLATVKELYALKKESDDWTKEYKERHNEIERRIKNEKRKLKLKTSGFGEGE